jgi:hypothetical protein
MRNSLRSLVLLAAGCVIGGTVVLGVIFIGSPSAKPALPALLRNVAAGGGLWGACPPDPKEETRALPGQTLALSPQLNQRLAQSFPPGSSERGLSDTLSAQGFELLQSCKNDPSIRVAEFSQHGGGFFSPPIVANVFWKADEAGNIVWTKGFVRYVAL